MRTTNSGCQFEECCQLFVSRHCVLILVVDCGKVIRFVVIEAALVKWRAPELPLTPHLR